MKVSIVVVDDYDDHGRFHPEPQSVIPQCGRVPLPCLSKTEAYEVTALTDPGVKNCSPWLDTSYLRDVRAF
jgi:hypothetical protein